MADTQQGVRQQSARDAAGTTDTHSGDLRALFESVATVPAGSTYNEAFMLWLQSVTGSSSDNINDLHALYASQQDDTYNWSSVGGRPELFSWNPELAEALPATATFTRASDAYEFDGTQYSLKTTNAIRDAHVALSGGARGYLGEPEATSNILNSDDFNVVSWSNSGFDSVTDDGTVSIGLRQHTFVADLSTTVHRTFTSSVQAEGVYFIVAQGVTNPIRYVTVRHSAGGGETTDYAAFDLQDGLVNEEGSNATGIITDLGVGVYKCEVIVTPASGFSVLAMSDTGTPGTGDVVFATTNQQMRVYQGQGENTKYTTSLIINGAVATPRAADILDSGVIIPSEFGALFDFTTPQSIGTGNTISLLGGATSAVDILRLDASLNVIMDDGGTPTTIGTVSAGQRFKISYGRDATGRSGSLDGATVVTGDAPSAAHEGENFQVYSTASVDQARGIGHISTIYSVRPTDEELEGLSA